MNDFEFLVKLLNDLIFGFRCIGGNLGCQIIGDGLRRFAFFHLLLHPLKIFLRTQPHKFRSRYRWRDCRNFRFQCRCVDGRQSVILNRQLWRLDNLPAGATIFPAYSFCLYTIYRIRFAFQFGFIAHLHPVRNPGNLSGNRMRFGLSAGNLRFIKLQSDSVRCQPGVDRSGFLRQLREVVIQIFRSNNNQQRHLGNPLFTEPKTGLSK